MSSPPSPIAHELLPPLLACLPASFISPRPPPALLPLLSPVLRQRLTYLQNYDPSSRDGWLPLLSWNSSTSARLPGTVEQITIEPHPVSGEIEIEEISSVKYRRLDQETLHARLEVEQFDLLPTYVWCESDEHGQTGPGWKLADLRTLQDFDDRSEWYDTVSTANQAAQEKDSNKQAVQSGNASIAQPQNDAVEEGDEDDYWAAYDQTPAQTPAPKASLGPIVKSTSISRGRSQSELEYFSRYGDVQPAMDAHDPDEASAASMAGESTLQGDALVRQQARQSQEPGQVFQTKEQTANHDHDADMATAEVSMPRPISPTSSTASSVDKLEKAAATNMTSVADDRAHVGIRQHISTDIKSLYRLAKSMGMSRDDFTDIINRELEVLSIFDQDD